MASRSSGLFSSENYIGTRRGRAAFGDMGMEQFPEKYEETVMFEDPEQLTEDQRETLKDFTPDNSRLFASEETRRNTYARDRLNLRDGGARTTTDPYSNEDFDISFKDEDPRGWSTEQPWQEYRRRMEAQLRMVDFKDDGDYSTTSGHIHPNTLYKTIRSAQDWVKARLKIFETSYTNLDHGGVGVYDKVSNVYKSESEDLSYMMDGSMNTTFEDPVNRSRATARLSNMLHMGSKALRANSTTDHKVLVAAYGKLMRQRGLINHENQLRLIEDDTNWSKIEGVTQFSPVNVTKLMSSLASDQTAAATLRMIQQDIAAPSQLERFKGMRYDESEISNRNNILTRDIITLLGVTENELKLLESKSNQNNKQAQHSLANLFEMVEAVHAQPAHIKLQIREELLLKSAGQGLRPGNPYETRQAIVINPKIIQFMDTQVRKSSPHEDSNDTMHLANEDSEGRLDKLDKSKLPVLIYSSRSRDSDDIVMSKHQTSSNHVMPGSKRAASYRNLTITATKLAKNRDKSNTSMFFSDSGKFIYGQNKTKDEDPYTAMQHAEIDNEFGENKALTRHIGRIGSKQMRRYQFRTDDNPTRVEIENSGRKNAKNAVETWS